MNKRLPFGLIAFVVIALVCGCANSTRRTTPAKEPVATIFIVSDIGVHEVMPGRYINVYLRIERWMKRDLARMLKRKGLEIILIESPEEYVPDGGKYLLSLSIVDYVPGRRRRPFGRYGRLQTSIALLENKEVLLSRDYEEVSQRGWDHAARKMNLQITRAVIVELARALLITKQPQKPVVFP